jgi:hypothetical protein
MSNIFNFLDGIFFFNKNGYEIILRGVAEPLVQITKCPMCLWDFYLDYIQL